MQPNPETNAHRATLFWHRSAQPVDYAHAVATMETRVAAIAAGVLPELLWFLTHPPVYTAGTSARDSDLVDPDRFPVHRTGRGGQFTYHGPGQRVVYVMVDVRRRYRGDVRAFVCALEAVIIDALAAVGVTGERRDGRVGVWVERERTGAGPREDKIAALGVRIRRGISFHGIAVNVDPTLEHFSGIVPCGIAAHGVTSLADLGIGLSMTDFDHHLLDRFAAEFGTLHEETGHAPLG